MKKAIIGIAVASLFCIGLSAVYIQRDVSFDKAYHVETRTRPYNWAEHIKIGVIGDSWVASQKLDHSIAESMMVSGIPAEVVSSGHPGAKSRQIYRNLLNNNQSSPYSSNHLLTDEDMDFLVIVAGVNDNAGHIGKEFYAHHMLLIIQAALDRGMTPVVVEVPEYGIDETPAVGLLSWGKRAIYLRLFDNGKVDVISDYRRSLRDRIPSAIKEKAIFVEFTSIAYNYDSSKSLYANPSHLNKDGYEMLGRLITDTLLRAIIEKVRCSMKEKGKRPNYTSEFKQDAVKLVVEQQYSCLR